MSLELQKLDLTKPIRRPSHQKRLREIMYEEAGDYGLRLADKQISKAQAQMKEEKRRSRRKNRIHKHCSRGRIKEKREVNDGLKIEKIDVLADIKTKKHEKIFLWAAKREGGKIGIKIARKAIAEARARRANRRKNSETP